MLFILCTWHAYAKLRLHTSSTLESLEQTTRALGSILRQFLREVCSSYATKELPTEEAARVRRRANNAAQGKGSKMSGRTGPAGVVFNMNTYKLHALGNYVASIWRYGTTDNYSTQVVSHFRCSRLLNTYKMIQGELEHHRIKRFYPRTNKRKTFMGQIGKHHRRQRILRKIHERENARRDGKRDLSASPPSPHAQRLNDVAVPSGADEPLPPTSPERHHHMSSSRRYPINIMRWTDNHPENPATRVCMPLVLDRYILIFY